MDYTGQDEVSLGIGNLWSSSDAERRRGLDRMLLLGARSVDRLIGLLSELVHDQRPRFPIDKEQEGATVLRDFPAALRNYSKDPSHYRGLTNRLSALAINSRLMEDVVYLLGELKAEPAVPILIEILNKHSGLPGLGGPEKSALCRIGVAAVPQLIESLDESKIRAFGFDSVVYGYRVQIDLSENKNADPEDPESDDEEDSVEADEKVRINRWINRVRQRVVFILGEIGDLGSLAALEKLLRGTKDEDLIERIQDAINKIQERNHFDHTGRRSIRKSSFLR